MFAITISPLLVDLNIYWKPDDFPLACSDCLMITADPEDVSLHFHASLCMEKLRHKETA